MLEKFPKAAAIKSLRDRNDFMFTLTVRMIGILPCDIVSLYFGACGVSYPHYLAACIIGMLPSIISKPILGMSAGNVRSPQFIAALCISAVFWIASLIACAAVKKKHRRQSTKEPV